MNIDRHPERQRCAICLIAYRCMFIYKSHLLIIVFHCFPVFLVPLILPCGFDPQSCFHKGLMHFPQLLRRGNFGVFPMLLEISAMRYLVACLLIDKPIFVCSDLRNDPACIQSHVHSQITCMHTYAQPWKHIHMHIFTQAHISTVDL